MKNRFNIILLVVFLLFLIAVITRFSLTLSFSDSKYAFNKDGEQKLFPHLPVEQKFIAQKNNLSHLRTAIKDFPKVTSDIIVLEIADANCSKTIAQSKINFWTMYYPGYWDFRFPTISDSAGKTFCAKFTFVPKQSRTKDLPKINISESQDFADSVVTNMGDTKKGPEFRGQTIIMKPAYSGTTFFQDINILIDRVSQYKPFYFKETYLYILSFLLILSSIALAVIIILI